MDITIQNAAPLTPATGNVARGEPISIYGANLSLSTEAAFPTGGVPVPTLGAASVMIGGLPAPLLYLSPTRLNVQAPLALPAGAASTTVTVTCK